MVFLLATALAQDSDSASQGTGEQGDPCTEVADCASDLICLVDGTLSYCTATCSEESTCPEGYACFANGDEAVCAVDASSGGGECGCGSTAAGPVAAWALVAAALSARARR